MSESATSQTTKIPRVRLPPESELVRPACFSASFTLVLLKRTAGSSPARTPASRETAKAKLITVPSTRMSEARGNCDAIDITINLMLEWATPTPKSPPQSESSTVSETTCCNTRLRVAPSAERIAISFWREMVLARTRLATFAQAINSTNATAPSNTSSAGRTSPTRSSLTGTTSAPHPLSSSGYCCSSRREIVFISACACFRSIPGRRRAITARLWFERTARCWAFIANGVQSLGASAGSLVIGN